MCNFVKTHSISLQITLTFTPGPLIDPNELEFLVDSGVDGIITDKPELLADIVAQKST